jgi:hypothetical protein
MPFTQRHDAIEEIPLYRPHEPLRVSIAVRSAGRRPDDMHAGRAQPLFHGAAPRCVAIAQERRPSDNRRVSPVAWRKHWMTMASFGYGVHPIT